MAWTNFKSIAQATYSAAGSPRTINATIPAGTVTNIQLVLTRPTGGFPAGGNYTATLTYADGAFSSCVIAGGDINDRFGIPLTQSTVQWDHPSGAFPAGAMSLVFTNDQAVTTAISINWS